MPDLNPQFIKTEAGELVVLTRAEYDRLVERAIGEDDKDVAIFDARMAELASGQDERLPAEVTARMLNGDTLFRALRKWKGATQADLANKTGLAQGYLSEIESGKKVGAPDTLQKIAAALDIDPRWIDASV